MNNSAEDIRRNIIDRQTAIFAGFKKDEKPFKPTKKKGDPKKDKPIDKQDIE